MQPSHGKLKSANSGWQTQVGVCERYKNSRQTRFYLTPTVCKRVCRLFLSRSHTPTWVCQHEFANLSLPCEGRLTGKQTMLSFKHKQQVSKIFLMSIYIAARQTICIFVRYCFSCISHCYYSVSVSVISVVAL